MAAEEDCGIWCGAPVQMTVRMVNVSFTLVAQTMNDAETVENAGYAMENADEFQARLEASSSFQQARISVESTAVLDTGASYDVPELSAANSKVSILELHQRQVRVQRHVSIDAQSEIPTPRAPLRAISALDGPQLVGRHGCEGLS